MLTERLGSWLGLDAERQQALAISIVAILLLWAIRLVILKAVARRTQSEALLYRWRKGSSYVSTIIVLVLLGRIWFGFFDSLSSYLGLVSAGLAVAMSVPLVNLAGWLFILWRRPFTVGDRIEVGSSRGDVLDVRLFQFSLLEVGGWVDADQSSGRILHIPNRCVFTETIANYTQAFGLVWNEIPVLVTLESDWQRAKAILLEIAEADSSDIQEEARESVRSSARKYPVRAGRLTPIVYTRLEENGILLTIRYICEPRKRRGSETAIIEAILLKIAKEEQIDFAYTTRRLVEG